MNANWCTHLEAGEKICLICKEKFRYTRWEFLPDGTRKIFHRLDYQVDEFECIPQESSPS